MHPFLRLAATGVAVLLIGSAVSRAAPITFMASDGTHTASVTFDVVGGNLQVTLQNIGPNPALTTPMDVLTAVFFDISGNPTLTPVSASLAPGSTINNGGGPGTGTVPPGGNVGGEWAYARSASGGLGGDSSPMVTQQQGIGSAGFGIFGDANFGGPNLEGPDAVDGFQFGIIAAGAYNPNPGLSGSTMIQDAAVFTLSGIGAGFDPATAISNIRFQYGTDLGEPSISPPVAPPPPPVTPPPPPVTPPPPPPVIPVPPAVLLMSLGGVGLALARLRRRRLAA